jgi:hypothetical protein
MNFSYYYIQQNQEFPVWSLEPRVSVKIFILCKKSKGPKRPRAVAYIWLKQGVVKILYLTGRSSQHPTAEAYLDQRLQFFTLPFDENFEK